MCANLSIIILNWNAAEDTISCVQNILTWQHLEPSIFVVDNASVDGNVDQIKRACPMVRLICSTVNLGFAGGTNLGVKEALFEEEAPILLLNNDAIIKEDDAAHLLKTLSENEKVGFIGPLLFDADQPDKLLSAGGKSPIKHHQTRIVNLTSSDPLRIVEYVSGTAVLVRADVFRTVGFLDENYFFSTELADLCMRAKQRGYLSAIDTQARAYHKVSRSAGLRDTLFVYYIIRNRFIYIRNSPHKIKIGFFAFWTLYSMALSLKLMLSGNRATAKAVWIGLVDGLKGRFGGQNERVLAAVSKLTQPSGTGR